MRVSFGRTRSRDSNTNREFLSLRGIWRVMADIKWTKRKSPYSCTRLKFEFADSMPTINRYRGQLTVAKTRWDGARRGAQRRRNLRAGERHRGVSRPAKENASVWVCVVRKRPGSSFAGRLPAPETFSLARGQAAADNPSPSLSLFFTVSFSLRGFSAPCFAAFCTRFSRRRRRRRRRLCRTRTREKRKRERKPDVCCGRLHFSRDRFLFFFVFFASFYCARNVDPLVFRSPLRLFLSCSFRIRHLVLTRRESKGPIKRDCDFARGAATRTGPCFWFARFAKQRGAVDSSSDRLTPKSGLCRVLEGGPLVSRVGQRWRPRPVNFIHRLCWAVCMRDGSHASDSWPAFGAASPRGWGHGCLERGLSASWWDKADSAGLGSVTAAAVQARAAVWPASSAKHGAEGPGKPCWQANERGPGNFRGFDNLPSNNSRMKVSTQYQVFKSQWECSLQSRMIRRRWQLNLSS